MAAKSLLFRPNVAALCLAGSRSFLRRKPSIVIMPTSVASYNLSSGRPLLRWRLPPSSSASPIRRNFCIRATTESDSSAYIGSPLMETMENKVLFSITSLLISRRLFHYFLFGKSTFNLSLFGWDTQLVVSVIWFYCLMVVLVVGCLAYWFLWSLNNLIDICVSGRGT